MPSKQQLDRLIARFRRRFPTARVKRLIRGQPAFSLTTESGCAVVYFRGGWHVGLDTGFALNDAEAIRTVLEKVARL